jgi:uncharacterized YigZ family protein
MNKDNQSFLIPTGTSEFRMTERGSRFLGWCAPAEDEAAAQAVLAERSRLHHDATHHCWAFRVSEGNNELERSSDAGEPSGTAGIPILEQLRKSNLSNVVLVVTRWFGGTKLGRGGLIRAYRQCAAGTIALLPTKMEIPCLDIVIDCPYDLIGFVEHTVKRFEGEVTGGDYSEEAHIKIRLPIIRVDEFTRFLEDEGGGKVQVQEAMVVK